VAYHLPTFNLVVNIWWDPVNWLLNPPSLVTTGNLCIGLRVWAQQTYNDTLMYLLLPPLTDVRDNLNGPGVAGDVVEVPAGTGRFYRVQHVDDVGKGFANEHRYCLLSKLGAWPVPIP